MVLVPTWTVLMLEDYVRRHDREHGFVSPRAWEGFRRYRRGKVLTEELEREASRERDQRLPIERREWADTIPGEGWLNG